MAVIKCKMCGGDMELSNRGFDFVFGNGSFAKLSSVTPIPIQLNPSINIATIKVG